MTQFALCKIPKSIPAQRDTPCQVADYPCKVQWNLGPLRSGLLAFQALCSKHRSSGRWICRTCSAARDVVVLAVWSNSNIWVANGLHSQLTLTVNYIYMYEFACLLSNTLTYGCMSYRLVSGLPNYPTTWEPCRSWSCYGWETMKWHINWQ